MIRKLKFSDYKIFCKEIRDTWEYEKYIGTKESTLSSIICFLEYLINSSAAYVMEKDDSIIGVVMFKNKKSKSKKCFLKLLVNVLKTIVKFYKNGNVFLQLQNNEKTICEELYANVNKEYDLKITFIIIVNKYRGQGYGKEFFNYVYSYMENNGLKNTYLFSDEWCNHKFYDTIGMEKAGSIERDLLPSLKNAKFYMYEKTL